MFRTGGHLGEKLDLFCSVWVMRSLTVPAAALKLSSLPNLPAASSTDPAITACMRALLKALMLAYTYSRVYTCVYAHMFPRLFVYVCVYPDPLLAFFLCMCSLTHSRSLVLARTSSKPATPQLYSITHPAS